MVLVGPVAAAAIPYGCAPDREVEMDDVVAALAEQQDELTALLEGLSTEGWARPSACPGWTVADVVLHLAQTNEMANASLDGTLGEYLAAVSEGMAAPRDVDDAADQLVAKERGAPAADVLERWRAGVDALRARLGRLDPHQRVQWVAGDLSVHTLAATRLAETWIHTTDVGEALGIGPSPTPRLRHVARLAWRTLPYAFARAGHEPAGPVAFHLTGAGAEPWDFTGPEPAVTTVRGDALELCLVAGRRCAASETSLTADGPDADAVLELVRTFA
jgi:uncharacterized protein (TIGR03084 family)